MANEARKSQLRAALAQVFGQHFPPGIEELLEEYFQLKNDERYAAAGTGPVDAINTAAGDVRYLPKSLGGVQSVALENTNAGFGQATNQLIAGKLDTPLTDSLGFLKASVLLLQQKYATNGNNPTWLTMTVPDSPGANGIDFFGFGDNGGLYPKIIAKSNYGRSNPFGADKGLSMLAMVAERVTNSRISGYVFQACSIGNDTGALGAGETTFYGGTRLPLTLAASYVFEFYNWADFKFGVRSGGDVHTAGTVYNPVQTIAADFAPSLSVHTYKFTGGSGITCTLPSPGGDNTNRQIKIANYGTAPLNFSMAYYIDGTTSLTTLNHAAPDNKLTLVSDGTNWIAV